MNFISRWLGAWLEKKIEEERAARTGLFQIQLQPISTISPCPKIKHYQELELVINTSIGEIVIPFLANLNVSDDYSNETAVPKIVTHRDMHDKKNGFYHIIPPKYMYRIFEGTPYATYHYRVLGTKERLTRTEFADLIPVKKNTDVRKDLILTTKKEQCK